MDLFSLSGRVIVITGGAKGIGEVYSRELAGRGARVAIADIDPDATQALARELSERGLEVLAVPTDVSSEAATRNMAERTAERWGRIDGLVNNAALMSVLP